MKDTKKLLADHKKLIELEASRYSAFVPPATVLAEAYRLAADAAEKFDETKGIKFSTYLTNSLKKLSRISTQYGGTVRIPENKQFKIQKINQVETALRDELGRTPTLHELAEGTQMSIQQVSGLLGSRKKDVNFNNLSFTPVFIDDGNDEWLHFVYHDLPERDRYIFEHKTGFGGKPVKSTDELAKELRISPSTVANRSKMISEMIEKGWKS